MGLKDTLESIKEKIGEKKEKEAEAVDEAEEPAKEEETKTAEEQAKEEPKTEEPALKEEEKPDNAAMARARREKAAEQKRAREAEERAERLEAEKREKEEPKEADNSAAIESMLAEHTRNQAAKEFEAIESDFRRSALDYDAIAGQYAQALAQSIRIQNPRLSAGQIAERTADAILSKAAGFHRQGLNPAEELYYEAKELGIKPPVAQTEAKEEEPAGKTEKKPDMAKVAANRARNAGTAAAAGGQGEGQMTLAKLNTMTVRERMAIPKADRERIIRGGR